MTESRNIYFVWSDEMVSCLREMWGKPGNSAEKIATKMSIKFGLRQRITRNTIIGRARRMGLARLARGPKFLRDKHGFSLPRKPRAIAPKRVFLNLPRKLDPADEAAGPHSCSILEVTGCRYPVADKLFCNEPGNPW